MTTTAVEVQRRYLTIDKPQADANQLEFSFSSENPVTRYFGDEVLDHDRQAVVLLRLNGGVAPLLLALRASYAEDLKGWLALGREELGRLVVIEPMQDWKRPLPAEVEQDRLVGSHLGVSL